MFNSIIYGCYVLSDANPIRNMKIDEWYKVLIPFGASIFIISLIFSFEEYSRRELLLFGGGLILVGIGEWKNERFATRFVDRTIFNPFMQITQKFRGNDKLGVPLEITGLIAIIISLLSIFDVINI